MAAPTAASASQSRTTTARSGGIPLRAANIDTTDGRSRYLLHDVDGDGIAAVAV